MTTRRIVQGAIALVILAVVADVLSAYALFYSAATARSPILRWPTCRR
jgi:hypothetical protein